LAKHLELPLIKLSEFEPQIPREVAYLQSARGQKDFSALTLFHGWHRSVIYNDAHDKKRQAADIAHELAHCLLQHPPKPPFDAKGSRHYDVDREHEANWLGPALLISDEAAMWIGRQAMSLVVASDAYGASVDLVRMRLNVSGVAFRLGGGRAA
jgi:Zn-dependent peptidase ImmA (M78 family)